MGRRAQASPRTIMSYYIAGKIVEAISSLKVRRFSPYPYRTMVYCTGHHRTPVRSYVYAYWYSRRFLIFAPLARIKSGNWHSKNDRGRTDSPTKMTNIDITCTVCSISERSFTTSNYMATKLTSCCYVPSKILKAGLNEKVTLLSHREPSFSPL
jgi:predicted amidophosphoribosyltransferase